MKKSCSMHKIDTYLTAAFLLLVFQVILTGTFSHNFNIISYLSIGSILISTILIIISIFVRSKLDHENLKPALLADSSELVTSTIAEHLPINEQEKLENEAVLANIGEGLVVINKSGKIIRFNKAAESMLGWSASEAIGKNLADIIKTEYLDNKLDNIQTIGTKILYFLRKNKSKFPVSITTTSYIQGNNILGTITLFRDITVEMNVDKMKNEFISLASHQLRNPLSAIKWYSDMLLKGDVGKLLIEQEEYAKCIFDSTEKMIKLVNTLLNITRIESGRIIIDPVPTDLPTLAKDVIDEVKIQYQAKKLNYHLSVQDSLPSINIDPILIKQVYVNLLTNASKYSPLKSEINIKITKSDNEINTEISDKGYGIPQDEQGNIFTKFYRGKNIINLENDGTGLGLYMVKAIIELSQGNITFTSKEGQGSSFVFNIPISGTQPKKGVVKLESNT